MTITENNSERQDSYEKEFKNVQIIVADGAFTSIHKDLCHLLFYTHIPFLKEGKNNDTDIGQKEMLQVEIRMPTKHLQHMIENILEDINKKLKNTNEKETDFPNGEMFA